MLHNYLPAKVVYAIGFIVLCVGVCLLSLNIDKYRKEHIQTTTSLSIWKDSKDSVHYAYDTSCSWCNSEFMKKNAEAVALYTTKQNPIQPNDTTTLKVVFENKSISYVFEK